MISIIFEFLSFNQGFEGFFILFPSPHLSPLRGVGGVQGGEAL